MRTIPVALFGLAAASAGDVARVASNYINGNSRQVDAPYHLSQPGTTFTHSTASTGPSMDIAQAVSGYITKMVSVGDSAATGTSAAKMKILLLDNETVGLSPPSSCYVFMS